MRDDEYQAMYDLERTLWWYRGMRQITRAIIGDNLAPNQGVCFLDAGCGTGYSVTWLKEELKTDAAFGVDLSRIAASFWNRIGVRTAAVSSICELPYLSHSFDLVTCFEVIYQLDHDQAGAAVSELARVLKPGGLIYIREPAYDWLRGSHDKAVGTRHRYTLGELKGLVGSHGLIPRRATYANTLLFLPAVAHRLISKASGGEDSDVKPVAGWLDSGLRSILRVEASMLRRFNAFFGLSAIVLAQKTARPGPLVSNCSNRQAESPGGR
jgi:SAM-dependent methyltransferase